MRHELAESDYTRLVAASPAKWRDVWRVLWLTGIRVGELAALTPRQVDLEGGWLYIEAHDQWTPKAKHARKVPLCQEARDILRRRMQEFPARLFPTRPAIQQRMLRLKRKLGLVGICCHSFRHAFGSRLLRSGADLKTVASVLGHANVKTTDEYLHPDLERARLLMEKMA